MDWRQQECADSNFSYNSDPLSDEAYFEQKDADKRESERQALIQLEKAQVSFRVRSLACLPSVFTNFTNLWNV